MRIPIHANAVNANAICLFIFISLSVADLRDEDKVDLSHFELISVLGTGGK